MAVQRASGSTSDNNTHAMALEPSPMAGTTVSIPTPTSASKRVSEPEPQQSASSSKISFARGDSASDDDDESAEEQSYLLLHLIRVLALYLYVYLAQNPFLVDDLLLHSTTDLLTTQASKLELELHAMLLAYVENEIASNQFDGLVQEKHVFLAIKKLFRLEKVKAATQCQTLVALLSTYLSLLQSPIVHCEPFSMLISTLEYLAKQKKKQDVSLPLLYPIVNAIDSLSIEQRECLDALTTFWKWLAARDPSGMILSKIVSRHHSVIIQIDDQSSSPLKQTTARNQNGAELGACFVTTLLHHSDHIFRHDPEYSDFQTPLESDTEDDESTEDVGSEPVTSPPSTPPATLSTKTPTLPLLNTAEVEVATPLPARSATSRMSNNNGSHTKAASKSKGRRKKKGGEDQKLLQAVASATATAASAKQQLKKKQEALDADVASSGLQPVNPEDESLPAVLCVTIAAAAGTIAAALCVIFT